MVVAVGHTLGDAPPDTGVPPQLAVNHSTVSPPLPGVAERVEQPPAQHAGGLACRLVGAAGAVQEGYDLQVSTSAFGSYVSVAWVTLVTQKVYWTVEAFFVPTVSIVATPLLLVVPESVSLKSPVN